MLKQRLLELSPPVRNDRTLFQLWPEKVSFRDYLLFVWQALLLFSLVELSPFFPVSLIESLGQGCQEHQHSRSLYIHGSNGQNASLVYTCSLKNPGIGSLNLRVTGKTIKLRSIPLEDFGFENCWQNAKQQNHFPIVVTRPPFPGCCCPYKPRD